MRTYTPMAWVVLIAACGGTSDGAADGGSGVDVDGRGGDGAPAGDGIAAGYPGDLGIAGDPRVIFADDFENYAGVGGLDTRWPVRYGDVGLTQAAAGVFAGAQALEFTAQASGNERSTELAITLAPTHDRVYLRFYGKFESTFDITGSSHNGANLSSKYFVGGMATPGVPANGTNKFLVAYEAWREEAAEPNPGRLNVYVYHPEQRDNYGDHFFPDGTVAPITSQPGDFGPSFVARPQVVPELDRWYAYEVMVQANTPGQRDGRITCWLDGAVIADFPNLRLRDISELQIDRVGLTMHARTNPTLTRRWYDNVVVATEYIGPVAP